MGDCQNYGPFLGPYYNTGPNTRPNLGDPKRDHNFDNPPYILQYLNSNPALVWGRVDSSHAALKRMTPLVFALDPKPESL